MLKRAKTWSITKAVPAEHDEEEAGIAYFSLALSGPGHYLEFQLSLDMDERVDSDGNDEGYCVMSWSHEPAEGPSGEIDLSWLEKPTFYGGVRSCEFHSHSVILEFGKDLATTFQWPEKLTLNFDVDDTTYIQAKRALCRVLSNSPTGESVSICEA